MHNKKTNKTNKKQTFPTHQEGIWSITESLCDCQLKKRESMNKLAFKLDNYCLWREKFTETIRVKTEERVSFSFSTGLCWASQSRVFFHMLIHLASTHWTHTHRVRILLYFTVRKTSFHKTVRFDSMQTRSSFNGTAVIILWTDRMLTWSWFETWIA